VLVLHHPGRLRHLSRREERSEVRHREVVAEGEALSAAPETPAERAGALAALGATLCWGVNYTVAKRVLAEIDPLAVAGARALTGLVVFGAVLLLLDGPAGLGPRRLWRALPLGLFGIFANQVLFIEGLERTSPSHSSILVALLPVYVLVLSVVAHQERASSRKILGIGTALAGVVVVAAEKGLSLASGTLPGDLLTVGAGFSFAAYTVLGRPLLREFGPLRATALSFLGGGAGILLVAAPRSLQQPWRSSSPAALWGLAYVALVSTVLAYLLYYFAVDRLDPSKVAVFTYLQPLIAAAVAFASGGDRITGHYLVGGALILLGVVLAERG
jgi:drug/metabolite transporter (DMT)-like permease